MGKPKISYNVTLRDARSGLVNGLALPAPYQQSMQSGWLEGPVLANGIYDAIGDRFR